MKNSNNNLPELGKARTGSWKATLPYAIVGGVLVIYAGLRMAPYSDGGNIIKALLNFSKIEWFSFPIITNQYTLKMILILLMIYGGVLLYFYSSRKHYRHGVEKGSAEWADPFLLNKVYDTKFKIAPKIMMQHVAVSYNDFKHRRNLNTMIVGGSGAGKTRFYAKPNLMQGNTSFFCLDPKGELLRDTGNIMKSLGYRVKVLDLIHMDKSDKYNPFQYIKTDLDIMKLCTNLFKATGEAKGGSQDPFWDNAATALLMAIVSLLHYEAPPEEQNFAMVGECLRMAAITSENMKEKTPLDRVFDELPDDHMAKKFYRDYHVGGAKTLQSIQITLSARLNKFNIPELQDLTRFDMLNLKDMGEHKTVLYALIPDNDSSFNFLVSILYTQMFQVLMNSADFEHGGKLPIPVHLLMDEFANVALPDDFGKILATIRSRKISVSIIIQNMAQLKVLFEKEWESIVGNCDEFLYLGGNEKETHKYVSELLGKETIDMNTYGRTHGTHGSSSTNYQIEGRDLMTPDEVRLLDNSKALLFIKGERPCLDDKYDLMKHPNIDLGPDGKYGEALWYEHAKVSEVTFDNPKEVNIYDNVFEGQDNFEGYSAKDYISLIREDL